MQIPDLANELRRRIGGEGEDWDVIVASTTCPRCGQRLVPPFRILRTFVDESRDADMFLRLCHVYSSVDKREA